MGETEFSSTGKNRTNSVSSIGKKLHSYETRCLLTRKQQKYLKCLLHQFYDVDPDWTASRILQKQSDQRLLCLLDLSDIDQTKARVSGTQR